MSTALKELYRTMLTTRCLNKEIIQTEGKIEIKLHYKYYLSIYTFYTEEGKMSYAMGGTTIIPKDELDLWDMNNETST